MKQMFLPGVEQNPQPGPFRDQIEQMKQAGVDYPQIWHLFAFLPSATNHLARFTQEILRGPAPLSPGLRELIAAELPVLKEHDVSMWGYAVLLALDESPVRTQAALAESIGADKTRIIPTLDELQAKGHIERHADPVEQREDALEALPDRLVERRAAALGGEQVAEAAVRGIESARGREIGAEVGERELAPPALEPLRPRLLRRRQTHPTAAAVQSGSQATRRGGARGHRQCRLRGRAPAARRARAGTG